MSVALKDPAADRAAISQANGRLSHGPTTPEGKARSCQNSCKTGLTGAGAVLPTGVAREVEKLQAAFAVQLDPADAVEEELVRQMALGAWRSKALARLIVEHDRDAGRARASTWDEEQIIAAAEIGRRLADDPEVTVAKLRCRVAGCDWLLRRWEALAEVLDEPGGAWSDAEMALARDLLGPPADLRRRDPAGRRLERLAAATRDGSAEARAELRASLAERIAALRARRAWLREEVEDPQLGRWMGGRDVDQGPEGVRLRRYEAAAERLFRSAWTKLERLRKERGRPLVTVEDEEDFADLEFSPAPPRPTPPPPSMAAPRPTPPPSRLAPAPRPIGSEALLGSAAGVPVLDVWIGGRPPRS